MPDRYWVGGTASWDGTAGTKWAATSGGLGGASVPTSADDVFFDANSTGTVTIATGNTGAKSINCTGFTGTITGTAAITVSGSVTLVAAMTYTHTGTMTFNATGTLTTAGKTFSEVIVNGASITLTLGDALNISTRTVTVTQGTLTTAGFAVTAASLASSNSNVRTINLGASTITLSATTPINFSTSTNLTFNAGTSQINLSSNTASLTPASQTFNNVSFTSSLTGTRSITNSNTFANLTLVASATGTTVLALHANQIVTGTLNCAGSSVFARGSVLSQNLGQTRTVTVATLTADDCDFRDITLAGAAAGTTPTRAGNLGGNSGITFSAKTVYRVGTDTTWTGVNSWALTSGGAGADANFPLAQDTAVIDNSTTLTGTLAVSSSSYAISALNASNRTTGITLSHSVAASRYGSYLLGSGITVSGTSTQTFLGRGTMDFTSAGKTITFGVTMQGVGGTLRLLDALTSSGNVSLFFGTLNLNNFVLTSQSIDVRSNSTRTLACGTEAIYVTGSNMTVVTTINSTTSANSFTLTGSKNLYFSGAPTTGTRSYDSHLAIVDGARQFNVFVTGGTDTVSIPAANNLNFTGFAGTLAHSNRRVFGNLTLSSTMTLAAGTDTTSFGGQPATTINQIITTNGRLIDFPLALNSNSSSNILTLADALTMGSSRTFTLTTGQLALAGYTMTCGIFTGGSGGISFGGGTLNIAGSGASFTATGGTFTTPGTINMSAAASKTFAGGGRSFPTLVCSGGGPLIISGSNTFADIQTTVRPVTIQFTSGTTQTVTDFTLSGTPGNLVTIGATTTSPATLSKSSGTVSVDYLSISYSIATGGAIWLAGNNSTDGGNNSGWIFGTAPPPTPALGNFFLVMGGW